MVIHKSLLFTAMTGLLLPIISFAWPPAIKREASSGSSLEFNLSTIEFSNSLDLSNRLIKPNFFDLTKKYPVVLVLPSCGGSKGKNENQMRYWVREIVAAGFLVMNVDSLTPRGLTLNCRPRPIEDGRLLRDAYDAANKLQGMPYVDADRIFTIGFSLGAMTGLLAASPEMTADLSFNGCTGHRVSTRAMLLPSRKIKIERSRRELAYLSRCGSCLG